MLTGHASVESGMRGMSLGAYDYVLKPVDFEELLEKVRKAPRESSSMKDDAPRNDPGRAGRIRPGPSAAWRKKPRPLWVHTLAVPGCTVAAVFSAMALPAPLAVILAFFTGSLCAWSAVDMAGRIRPRSGSAGPWTPSSSSPRSCRPSASCPRASPRDQQPPGRHRPGGGLDDPPHGPARSDPENLAELRDSLSEVVRQVDRCKTITTTCSILAQDGARAPGGAPGADLGGHDPSGGKGGQTQGVAIVRDYGPDIPAIRTDVPLVRQVVLNWFSTPSRPSRARGPSLVSTRGPARTGWPLPWPIPG